MLNPPPPQKVSKCIISDFFNMKNWQQKNLINKNKCYSVQQTYFADTNIRENLLKKMVLFHNISIGGRGRGYPENHSPCKIQLLDSHTDMHFSSANFSINK